MRQVTRQAIIKRVAKSCEAESDIKLISNVLEDTGFFELLEAAIKVCGREYPVPAPLWGLENAIAKAKGVIDGE